MRKFRRDHRGAVTVFVTLLLIPAILVSGTGVDLARLYAARSVTRDANQLAANAVLASYDAVLQDLYGLYAVAATDDTLLAMVDTYVKASLFGEDVTDQQLGEFRLFAGTEDVFSSLETLDPLREGNNVAVLRRQIEEYSKWRVPVAIVKDILDRLDSDETKQLSENNKAAAQKIKVDEQLQVLAEKYKAVKDKVDQLSSEYAAAEQNAFTLVNGDMSKIQKQLSDLLSVRQEYEDAVAAGEDSEKTELIYQHYQATINNFASLVEGGNIGSIWKEEMNEYGDWTASWTSWQAVDGIQNDLSDSVSLLESTKSGLDELVELCQQADAAKNELRTQLDALESTLNNGTCTPELVENMKEEIADYRELLNYDFTSLGKQMKTKDETYIDSVETIFKDLNMYGQVLSNNKVALPQISFNGLKQLTEQYGYSIDLNITPHPNDSDKLKEIVEDVHSVTFTPPGGFQRFEQCSTSHAECYDSLSNLGGIKSESELTSEEKKTRDGIEDLYTKAKELWEGLTDYDPSPGAFSYPKTVDQSGNSFAVSKQGPTLDLGLGAFGDNLVDTVQTLTALINGSQDVQTVIGSVLDDAADRILLVGYDTQMFSCWTTQSGEVSLSGHEISAASSYFYRSELEYLYNGNLDAKSNLGAVTTTLLVIRFLANYASSYIIDYVNTEIQTYEELVSLVPYAGAVLRFLVRPLVVLAESLVDVANLRNHNAVPLLKKELDEWTVSLLSVIEKKVDLKSGGSSSESGSGLTYTDYLTIFLLAGNPDTIAARTGDLIALNVTTLQKNIAHNNKDTSNDERAEAIVSVKLFDLSTAYTTFSIQTTTAVRFVFLSMPFAQKGVNGVVPPKTFPVVETDYRGY